MVSGHVGERDGGGTMDDRVRSAGRQVGQQAHRSARKARPWLVGLGRLGYAAEGVVYTLIGVLAVQVALGRGGATTDNKGALTRIAAAPFGRALLIAVIVGIAGYALWRFLQAALDTDNEGSDARGLVKRLGYAGGGAVHVALALSALALLRTGSAGASSDTAAKDWTARLLGQPFGPWLVGLVGLGVIGAGGVQIYKGCTAEFRAELKLGAMGAPEERWVTRLGRVGYAARGLVFALIGLFLLVAARRDNPNEAHGLDGALAALVQHPFGPWLLGVVALGFVAYGLCLFAEARYRRMVIS
jgi:Na+/proline symporter